MAAYFSLMLLSGAAAAQSPAFIVSGRVYDRESPARRLEDLMVINLRTAQGSFGKADGTFTVTALQDDTLMIASSGYAFRKFCFRDSLPKPAYHLDVPLVRLNVQLREVSIFSPRELNSIYKDIQRLGYNKSDFQLSGINVVESPITFLYQEFSQLQRLKRHNAERINDERRRDLLKELL
ncbi:MAG: hypothetical protein RL021_1626, partial [Bacteroidota bacterium]